MMTKTRRLHSSLRCGTVLLMLAASGVSAGEVRFGLTRRQNLLEYGRQGRFFATTDYADTGYDYGNLTRGRGGLTLPANGLRQAWVSSGQPTLFGLRFEAPIVPNRCPIDSSRTPPDQFEHWFEDAVPLFDRVQIFWSEHVPEPHTWSASIRTPDGRLVRLDPDNARRIFPFDRTTIEFEPTPIETIYVGVRERPDGKPNLVSVRDIRVHLQEVMERDVTNHLIVAQPDLYRVHFSHLHPGMIDWLSPVNMWQYGPAAVFRWISPFLEVDGREIAPVAQPYPVEVERTVSAEARNWGFAFDCHRTAPLDLTLRYRLVYDLPDAGRVEVAVTSGFNRDPARPLTLALRADPLPPGTRIGWRFFGIEPVFGPIADATPELAGSPVALRTPGGHLTFRMEGADTLRFERADGLQRVRDWSNRPVDFVKVETRAEGATLDLTLTLPIGLAGRPQPETLNYTWRPSTATDAEPGYEWLRPYRPADLELMEEIDVGNPDGAHTFYDSRNDPVVLAKLEKEGPDWRPPRGQTTYGFLPFIDDPEAGAVPLVEIDGQTVRAIPDRMGSYFRFDLQSRFEPRTPYLVVFEHAFDRRRQGAFYSVTIDEQTEALFFTRGLYGGFETDADDPVGGFRKEYVLCYFNGRSHQSREGRKDSLVVVNKVHSGPWERVEGLAVKRIRIYRVHGMPQLPDFAPLLPEPSRQRTVVAWSEHDRGSNPWYLFEYPRLMGYSTLWTHHDAATRSFGGNPVRLTNVDQWAPPGTLAGNLLLFEAAEAEDLYVNIHLGQLLKIGFEGTDYESYLTSTYMQDGVIPLKPTDEERAHLATALRNVLPHLARYRSLRDVSTHLWLTMPFSLRNLRDFVADTGAPVTPSPLAADNVQALLNAGPEVLSQWRDWAGAQRFAFHQWLLAELRQYRPDLFLTLLRFWDHHLIEHSVGRDVVPGVDRRRLAAAGIETYLDYLRLLGFEPSHYAGVSGFSMEIEAYARLRAHAHVPEYFETDWFREMKAGFDREGLGVMVHCATLEMTGPLMYYVCPFIAPPLGYREGLIRSLLYGNPRNITLGSYNEPWGPRLADFREFAVAYRLLPFAAPEPFAGTVSDTSDQAVVRRYGERHGLINAGVKPTVVTLELPEGAGTLTDLSGGSPRALPVERGPAGRLVAEIAMAPWSLKTLEIE